MPPSHETRIKICGITRIEDARSAVSFGAWALGFVFYAKSPRYVALERARQMISELKASGVQFVGVFVNPSMEELEQVVVATGITMIQLHGNESVEFCGQVKQRFSLPIIKAFRLSETMPAAEVDFALLDHRSEAEWGGTGIAVDWNLASRVDREKLILAGGLTPENIKNAIEIVRPMAVDVSSGLELAPGVKSMQKMKNLFLQVLNADRSTL